MMMNSSRITYFFSAEILHLFCCPTLHYFVAGFPFGSGLLMPGSEAAWLILMHYLIYRGYVYIFFILRPRTFLLADEFSGGNRTWKFAIEFSSLFQYHFNASNSRLDSKYQSRRNSWATYCEGCKPFGGIKKSKSCLSLLASWFSAPRIPSCVSNLLWPSSRSPIAAFFIAPLNFGFITYSKCFHQVCGKSFVFFLPSFSFVEVGKRKGNNVEALQPSLPYICLSSFALPFPPRFFPASLRCKSFETPTFLMCYDPLRCRYASSLSMLFILFQISEL